MTEMEGKPGTHVRTKEALGATMKMVANREEKYIGRDIHFANGSHKLMEAEAVAKDDGGIQVVKKEVIDLASGAQKGDIHKQMQALREAKVAKGKKESKEEEEEEKEDEEEEDDEEENAEEEGDEESGAEEEGDEEHAAEEEEDDFDPNDNNEDEDQLEAVDEEEPVEENKDEESKEL